MKDRKHPKYYLDDGSWLIFAMRLNDKDLSAANNVDDKLIGPFGQTALYSAT